MSRPIVVVTGSTRCGTSLVMGMLHAGGLSVVADNTVAFEDGRTLGLPNDSAWLSECEGKAVKILEPLYFRPPAGRRYRFVLMRRDPVEQARSQIKFNRYVGGINVPDSALGPLAQSLRDDYPKMAAMLGRLGPVMTLAFEDVLANPSKAADQLARFLSVPLDAEAMARRVRPRTPECLPGFLELDLIDEQSAVAS